MTKITHTTFLTLSILLIGGSPSRIDAQGDTKVTGTSAKPAIKVRINDGGSILLQADGLDAGVNWSPITPAELRILNATGVLLALRITDGGADQCAGDPKCGIDPTQPWTVQVTYGAGSLTVAPTSANQGLHLTNTGLPFDQWQTTANTDERVFGHGDGLTISNITVNSGASLCSGKGSCKLELLYLAQ